MLHLVVMLGRVWLEPCEIASWKAEFEVLVLYFEDSEHFNPDYGLIIGSKVAKIKLKEVLTGLFILG